MSEFVICEKSDLVNVADAIREKTGKTDEMTIEQMAVEITGIGGGSGGGATLLYRAEVTEPVSLITVDVPDEWKRFSAWIICPKELKFSTKEWLYIKTDFLNASNYLGFSSGAEIFYEKDSKIVIFFTEDKAIFRAAPGTQYESNIASLKQIQFYPYYSTSTMLSGAVEIHGVML